MNPKDLRKKYGSTDDNSHYFTPFLPRKDDQISENTLKMIDKSIKNFAKGIVGDPIKIEKRGNVR